MMSHSLTAEQIRSQNPVVRPNRGLGRFIWVLFSGVFFNPFNIGFAILMPVIMYLMFGANQEYSDFSVGNGNVASQVLVSMTLFGMMMTTSSFAANVSLERAQGVSRLYALTPMSALFQLVGRMVAILCVGCVVVLITFGVGVATGASMLGVVWAQSVPILLAVSTVGIAIGFGCGFAVRSDGAFAATSAIVVLSAFGGGLTIPLDQMGAFFQSLAPWTPLWGAGQMVLLPIHGWENFTPNMLVNVAIWAALFIALAVWGLRRDTGR